MVFALKARRDEESRTEKSSPEFLSSRFKLVRNLKIETGNENGLKRGEDAASTGWRQPYRCFLTFFLGNLGVISL